MTGLAGALRGLHLLLEDDTVGPYRIIASRWVARPGPRHWRFEGLQDRHHRLLLVHTGVGANPD